MITISWNVALADPEDQSASFRERAVSVIAHEIAHHRVGDLATAAWWDDLWLNEGLATWMEQKIAHRFGPAFGINQGKLMSSLSAMYLDSLLSTPQVRREILAKEDLAVTPSEILYQKGGALLDMFEGWLGEAAFQKGMSRYLERYSFKSATTFDFLTALGEGAGRDVKSAFSTFLDKPGVPAVSLRLTCNAGAAKLALAQERMLILGSKAPAAGSLWQIPVCVRYGAGKASARACTLLSGATGEMELPSLEGGNGACPEWVMPKEGGRGYYRVSYTSKEISALLAR